MWIIVSGNPMDGIDFHGPFDSPNEADKWAEYALPASAHWWAAYVYPP